MPPLTREELDKMMQDNLEKMADLLESKLESFKQSAPDKPSFEAMRMNHYATFNVTTAPLFPQGTEIIIDLRPAINASGIMARYLSIGNKYVEEWAKQVNP